LQENFLISDYVLRSSNDPIKKIRTFERNSTLIKNYSIDIIIGDPRKRVKTWLDLKDPLQEKKVLMKVI